MCATVRSKVLMKASLALLMGGLASAAYQMYGSARDRRCYPPPGELVDIGGRRLHLWSTGDGSPAVVIVAALGSPGLEWVSVQRELARHTTVCTYDRAGLGWSDPGPRPRTAGRMADELHRLLRAAVEGPYILVGHSLGGYVVRLYATRYPERVVGMVLVDSSHEDQSRRLAEVGIRAGPRQHWLQAAKLRCKPLGLVRFAARVGLARGLARDAARSFPPDLLDAGVALSLDSKQRRADVQELLGFARSAAQVRAEAGHLGQLPLTVVTRRNLARAGGRRRGDEGHRRYSVWFALQRELVELSERSTHLIAHHAGHHVHRDEPDLVVRAILQQVEQCRSARAGK